MTFISTAQLAKDINAWTTTFQKVYAAVIGIERSGLLPAALLGLRWNIPVVPLRTLISGDTKWTASLRRGGRPFNPADPVLVVDDTVATGDTMTETIAEIEPALRAAGHDGKFETAAVYVRPQSTSYVDHFFAQVSSPRVFEWNWVHSLSCRYMMFDFDGVLCTDFVGLEADDEPGRSLYADRIILAHPYLVPSFPIRAIVTNRLERYRGLSEAWLKRARVEYQRLYMRNFPTARARREAGLQAEWKAAVYAGDDKARLFIESDRETAQKIAAISGKATLCPTTMEFHACAGS